MITGFTEQPITAKTIFDKFEKYCPRHGYHLQEVTILFENKAFKENPYQFTLEHLVIDHYTSNSVNEFPVLVMMKGLPDFKKKASVQLLRNVAKETFQDKPLYHHIMQVFDSSIKKEKFLMHFEFYRNHTNIYELNALLRNLFEKVSSGEEFSIDKRYKESRKMAHDFE